MIGYLNDVKWCLGLQMMISFWKYIKPYGLRLMIEKNNELDALPVYDDSQNKHIRR